MKHLQELRAYDPKLGEPPTPEVARALEASLQDPDLRRQHEAERAFDSAFREKLGEIPVPAGLAGRIKAAAGVEATPAPPEPRARGWWVHVGLLGSVAAAIVVLSIAYTFFINPYEARATPQLVEMVEGIEASLEQPGGMYFADGYEALVSHLASSRGPIPASLPAGIQPNKGFACREVEIRGTQVTMLCFNRDEASFHLFTFSRDALPRQEDILRPVIREFESNNCATWTDEQNVYVLATSAPRTALEKVL